jgi:uncharacterized protein YndB with AHSA1/START domain
MEEKCMSSQKRIQFTATIDAPVERVFTLMIDPEAYRRWTAVFSEGSYFEGSWRKGERIRFLVPSGEGMVAEIAEHRANEFLSIRHLGSVSKGVEDTESDAVRAWAPAYENYSFEACAEGTRVVVEMDVTAGYEAFMMEKWPKALEELKAICEGEA